MSEKTPTSAATTSDTRRRVFGRVMLAVAAGVIVTASVFAVIRTRDMPPDGPTCAFRGSSDSDERGGVERIDWGPLPIRVCSDGSSSGASDDGLLWVVSSIAGIVGGAFAYGRLRASDQRRADRLRFSRVASTALTRWREQPYDVLLELVDEPVHDLVRGPEGEALNLEVNAVIDDEATQNVRVIAAVDDGGLGVWMRPGCADFVKRPDGTFVEA